MFQKYTVTESSLVTAFGMLFKQNPVLKDKCCKSRFVEHLVAPIPTELATPITLWPWACNIEVQRQPGRYALYDYATTLWRSHYDRAEPYTTDLPKQIHELIERVWINEKLETSAQLGMSSEVDVGAMWKTQNHYRLARELLSETLETRLWLLNLAHDTTVDPSLRLCALHCQIGQGEDYSSFVSTLEAFEAFKSGLERVCDQQHIRALLKFDERADSGSRKRLTQLIMMSTARARERNNRELLWVRLHLRDEAATLFTKLVAPVDSTLNRSSMPTQCAGSIPASQDPVVVDTPKQPGHHPCSSKSAAWTTPEARR